MLERHRWGHQIGSCVAKGYNGEKLSLRHRKKGPWAPQRRGVWAQACTYLDTSWAKSSRSLSSNVASACQALDNVAMGKKVVVHEGLKKSKVEGVPTDPACGKAGVHSSALKDAVDRASVQQGAPALHTGGQIGTQARSGLTGGCWHRRRCAFATDRSARRARQARSRGGGLEHGLGVAAEAFRSVT